MNNGFKRGVLLVHLKYTSLVFKISNFNEYLNSLLTKLSLFSCKIRNFFFHWAYYKHKNTWGWDPVVQYNYKFYVIWMWCVFLINYFKELKIFKRVVILVLFHTCTSVEINKYDSQRSIIRKLWRQISKWINKHTDLFIVYVSRYVPVVAKFHIFPFNVNVLVI